MPALLRSISGVGSLMIGTTLRLYALVALVRLLTRARTALMGAQGLFHPWRLCPAFVTETHRPEPVVP